MRDLLRSFSLRELLAHPWRSAAAILAVMLGVALAFSVHLINASALSEFSSAVRSVNGQPDLELRAVQGGFDETLYARVAALAQVATASPVLELSTLAMGSAEAETRRVPVRVLGVDALAIAGIAPELIPRLSDGAGRFDLFAPDAVFLNAAAQRALGTESIRLQAGLGMRALRVAGTVAAGGTPLVVMDIGAAQDLFARGGELTRIDLRLRPGRSSQDLLRAFSLPPGVVAAEPDDAARRVSHLSRAYRVNLTVLALVALFTGAFLVFSVLSLSVSRRQQQFALLGVLGLSARQRLHLVLAESGVLGTVGSVAGIALGTALAALAMRLLGGDLGGGYFEGVTPRLQWDTPAAVGYAALGVLAALVGGWLPARTAQALPIAQALKGLGSHGRTGGRRHWVSLGLVACGGLLAMLPPIAGLPIGAYVSVGLLLVGGITALPWLVSLVYDLLAPRVASRVLPLLAVERARRVRESAAVAVSGIVASLALAVALTVMVASFRASVTEWLDVILPADLYARTSQSTAAGDTAFLEPSFVESAARLPGVARIGTQRVRSLQFDPGLPPVALLARPIDDPATGLPLVGTATPPPPGRVPVYVSEAMLDLYGVQPGDDLPALARAFGARGGAVPAFFIAGVWRDYVRQSGAIMMRDDDYRRLTGDARVNDLQLWLAPGVDAGEVRRGLEALALGPSGGGELLQFSSAQEIRAVSLRIFDRSFAVTYWLQAVAIAIGLFGVAASFSAQVLARRKEFGLLQHLGLTRRQVLAVVAGEGAAWTLVGSAAGLLLGLAVSVVLVHVVNPQSFHWTMDLQAPWGRLVLLCAAVVVAGTGTAWLAGRAAAGHDAVLAVKEDW